MDAIKSALLAVTENVHHFTAPQNVTGSYIVWAEDGQADAVWADGEMQEQVITGTVDYYTKAEQDGNIRKIQSALNNVCSWRLESIQYEDQLIHYEWVWEIGSDYL